MQQIQSEVKFIKPLLDIISASLKGNRKAGIFHLWEKPLNSSNKALQDQANVCYC